MEGEEEHAWLVIRLEMATAAWGLGPSLEWSVLLSRRRAGGVEGLQFSNLLD